MRTIPAAPARWRRPAGPGRLVPPAERANADKAVRVLEDGLGRLTTPTPGGRAIPQVLVDFQMRPNGGDGWLRLLEFKADGTTVEAIDYSPTRKQRNESAQNRFALVLPPVGRAG